MSLIICCVDDIGFIDVGDKIITATFVLINVNISVSLFFFGVCAYCSELCWHLGSMYQTS